MIRSLVLIACLAASSALAEEAGAPMTPHGSMTMTHAHAAPMAAGALSEVGQGAFAAIQEIVQILEADPATDWSKVDIDALRRHLVDMGAVFLRAQAASVPVDGGMRFDVTGEGEDRASIRRMVAAHAAATSGVEGWRYEAVPTEAGASMTVRAPPKDLPKLKALGFFGVMTLGMHHQMHHWMIANGMTPAH